MPRASTSPHNPIPGALRYFDSLPDSAHVRLPVVRGLTGASTTSIWRMSKDGRLPPPEKISVRVTAWNVGALRRALGLK